MHRIRLTDRSRRDLFSRMDDRRNEIAIPHQEPHAAAFDRLDQPIRFAAPRRQRLVLHDVFSEGCRANAQINVPFSLWADDRDLHVELAQRPFDITDVRNLMSVGKLLIPLVRPIGNLRIIRDHDQLEPRMRRQPACDELPCRHRDFARRNSTLGCWTRPWQRSWRSHLDADRRIDGGVTCHPRGDPWACPALWSAPRTKR